MLLFFFFNDTATTEIYTLSLHDALPIYSTVRATYPEHEHDKFLAHFEGLLGAWVRDHSADRKSTRLNSSHANISYAVFCLKKKILLEIVLNRVRNVGHGDMIHSAHVNRF